MTAPPMAAPRRAPGRVLWTAPVRDPVLAGLVVVLLALVVFYAGELGDQPGRIGLYWPIQVLLDGVFVGLGVRVARLPAMVGPARRFWRIIALAGLVFTAGDATQMAMTRADHTRTALASGTAQTVLIGAGAVLVVVAMLTHPVNADGRERMRLWLDAATIMTGVGVFVWAFSLASDPTGGAPTMLAVGSSAVMLLCAFAVVKLLLGGNAPFTPLAGLAAGFSATLIGLTTGLGGALAHSADPDLACLARLLPCVLLAATPRIQELYVRADPAVLTPRPRRPYSRLPYLAVLATQALLVVILSAVHLDLRAWGVLAGVLTITALVVIRQLAAFTDANDLLLLLGQQESRFRSLVAHASDITVTADARGLITYASPAVERVLGRPPALMVAQTLESLVHPEDQPGARARLAEVAGAPRATVDLRLRVRHRDGSWRWLEVICTNLLDDPSVGGLIINARDITETLRYQERLTFEATHDPLTGLANRALLQQRMEAEASGQRAGRQAAVLAVDLDDFKAVNDSLGHHVGDGLLVSVAARLSACVPVDGTVARLGGDEFAVFLPATGRSAAAGVARRILAALDEPVMVEGHALTVRGSVGVATAFGRDANALLRAADAAMYRAKQSGKGTYATVA